MVGTQNILQPLEPAPKDCKLAHLHTKRQRQLTFEQRVDERIEALLARVEGVRRGTTIDRPVVFGAAGQAHATAVA